MITSGGTLTLHYIWLLYKGELADQSDVWSASKTVRRILCKEEVLFYEAMQAMDGQTKHPDPTQTYM